MVRLILTRLMLKEEECNGIPKSHHNTILAHPSIPPIPVQSPDNAKHICRQ